MQIPIFSFSEQLIKHVPIPVLLLVASASYCVRVVAYTMVDDPWFVLLVEPLHGVTFACSQLAAVHYTDRIAPPGLKTSAQGGSRRLSTNAAECACCRTTFLVDKSGWYHRHTVWGLGDGSNRSRRDVPMRCCDVDHWNMLLSAVRF